MKKSRKRKLIIDLIKQDMKHQQLIGGLESLGFENRGLFSLELSVIIAGLMKVKAPKRDLWNEVYSKFLVKAEHIDVKMMNTTLESLAAECYSALREQYFCLCECIES